MVILRIIGIVNIYDEF